MNNFDRGDKAYQALAGAGYEQLENTLDVDMNPGYPISDLIADLGHLAARHQLDFAALVSEGVEHFGADCIEQAWEHGDEGWDNLLQAASNIGRAEEVLRINNVHPVFWGAIMVKVGLVKPDERDDYESGFEF